MAGKDMVGALGAEVDRLENEVRELVPGLRHIDLETDRGGRATASGPPILSHCVATVHYRWLTSATLNGLICF